MRRSYAADYDDEPVYGGGTGRIQIIPRTIYTFNGANAGTNDIPLVTRIHAAGWVSGVLSVRLHERTIAAGAVVSVFVQNVSYAPDEPHTLFIDSPASTVATVTINSTDSAPRLYTAAFAAPIGPMVRVLLRYVQAGTAGASSVGLSIDLEARAA